MAISRCERRSLRLNNPGSPSCPPSRIFLQLGRPPRPPFSPLRKSDIQTFLRSRHALALNVPDDADDTIVGDGALRRLRDFKYLRGSIAHKTLGRFSR